jgi:hypothetical protein
VNCMSSRLPRDIHCAAHCALHPDASAYARKFAGRYAHRVIEGGVGRNLPQEAPLAFAQAIIDVDGY